MSQSHRGLITPEDWQEFGIQKLIKLCIITGEELAHLSGLVSKIGNGL